MKIICGERVLDLDRMNSIMPDGEHVWAEVRPFTYSPDRLPKADAGTYLLTSDQGAVSFRDLAFKILIDMGVWSGAKCVRYVERDIARGVARYGCGWDTAALSAVLDAGCGAAVLRSALELRSVYMPYPAGILRSNLGALLDGPCDLDGAAFGLLSEYVYIPDGAAFQAVHGSLSDLLASFGPDDFAMFVDGIYGVVSSDPEDVRARLAPEPEAPAEQDQAAAGGVEEPAQEKIPDGAGGQDEDPLATEPGAGPAPAKAMDMDAMCNASVRDLPRRPLLPGGTGLFSSGRKLKGSDLTGTDETYSMEYYAGFYRDAMEKADSTGFADQLIRARAGHGIAPIAILEEAVGKFKAAVESQQGDRTQAGHLRSMLLDMAGALTAATDKLDGLPEPVAQAPVPEPGLAGQDCAGSGPASQAAAPEPEQAVQEESVPEPAREAASEQAVGEEEPVYDIPNYGDEEYDEGGEEDGPPDEEEDDGPPDGDF